MLSLRHFRLARWCSLSLGGWWPKTPARRISTCSDRLGSPAAPSAIPFQCYSGSGRRWSSGDRSERRCGRRGGTGSASPRPDRNSSLGGCLRRVRSLQFQAGGMVLFIPWRAAAERPAGSCPSWRPRRRRFLFGEFCLANSFCPDRLAAPAACGIGSYGVSVANTPIATTR